MKRIEGMPYRPCEPRPPQARRGKVLDIYTQPRTCYGPEVDPEAHVFPKQIAPTPNQFPRQGWWK